MSSVHENAKPSQVSTTSSVTDNAQDSKLLIASPDTEKPEQSLSLMTNPFSVSLNSKVGVTETESGHEEVASALPIDRLNIAEDSKQDSVTSPAKSVNEAFLDFNRLPGEIRKRIVKYAMTAEEGILEFTDRVGHFKPNVATGLLTAK